MNDLKNFYENEDLEIIGGVNDRDNFSCRDIGRTMNSGIKITTRQSEIKSGGSFYLVFYKRPEYAIKKNFSIFAEVVYEDFNENELSALLN